MNPLQIGVLFLLSSSVSVLGRSPGRQACSMGFNALDVKGTEMSKRLKEARIACGCYEEEQTSTLVDGTSDTPPSCSTKNGLPCQLPFAYKGKVYNKCTNQDMGGVYWCRTGPGQWDFGACNTTNPDCVNSYKSGCPSNNPTAPCTFPFKYKGKYYNGCIRKDFESRWCGTAPEVEIVHWALCEPSCPDDNIQPEMCMLNKMGWIMDGKVNGEVIERSLNSYLDNKPLLKNKAVKAYTHCFKKKLDNYPSIGEYLKDVEAAQKLACFKININ